MWQTTAYWIMGAMSNDPAKLAHFTGFCTPYYFITVLQQLTPYLDKSLQSAGAAGIWRADAVKLPCVVSICVPNSVIDTLFSFLNVFMSTWALLVAGLVFALPMIYMRVTNHTEYRDETLCVKSIKF